MNEYSTSLYQKLPQLVLGFHGCDQSVVDKIINSQTEHLHESTNDYDWLGNGIYFWLNDPVRAMEWAESTSKRRPDKVRTPAVIGAVIDLGNCLNLNERSSILLLQKSYDLTKQLLELYDIDINEKYKNKAPDAGGFNLIRPLDCIVIENAHRLVEDNGDSFDTVYGYFQEGDFAFPNAGIRAKSHVQVCVRNKSCIKGYFLPRIDA